MRVWPDLAARLLVCLVLALTVILLAPGAPAGAQTATEEATDAGEAAPENISGTIRAENEEGDFEGVEGVEIVVATAAGEEVETVTTDAEGNWEVDLPGAGEYQATVNEETLPEGVGLRDPERATLEFSIASGQSRPLIFPLGEGDAATSRQLEVVLQFLVEGIKFGLIIAIASIGLSLIFGTTGLVNFAHGEMVSFGAIIAYFFNVTLGLHLILAVPLALVFGALTGAALDLGLFRPLRQRGTGLIAALVVTVGLSLVWRYGMLFQFGGGTRPFAQYAVQRAIPIGPIQIAPKDLFAIVISIVVLIAVGLMLQRTKIGKAMRAVADNRDLAESSGIDVQRVILFVWMLGGLLATLGGVFLGLAEQVSWQMGFQLLLLMFAGVVLGGLGTAYGALVGSLIVGIFVQMSTLVIPTEMKNVGAFVVLILVLLVRPQGILGRAERVG